jgi:hypothetical protein
MDAVEALPAADAPGEDRKPVALVLLGYGATVMIPTIGILFALATLTRPGRWAKKQGMLMIGLATLMLAFGVALVPMLTESYFAGQANSELQRASQVTRHEEAESQRRFHTEMSRLHKEEAATDARIRRLRKEGGR